MHEMSMSLRTDLSKIKHAQDGLLDKNLAGITKFVLQGLCLGILGFGMFWVKLGSWKKPRENNLAETYHLLTYELLLLVVKIVLRRFPLNIRAIKAKIKLPKKSHGMVTF